MKTVNPYFTFFTVIASVFLLWSCSGENTGTTKVGDTIAPFSRSDIEGRTFSLASRKGNPVIIRFFLLNCPTCKMDTLIFNSLYTKYRESGLEIIYINSNGTNAAAVKSFKKALNIDFPIIYDPEGNLAKQYNVKVQPLTLVLSPEHKILAAQLGGVSETELIKLLSQYFQ